jgi:acyl-CoA synthetase (AMP-forming)/AMP-acid ligase II
MISQSTVLSAILPRYNDTSIALRYLTPTFQTEEWTYQQLIRSALLLAHQFPSIKKHSSAHSSANTPLPCALVLIEEGPALAISQLAAMVAGYVVVPASPHDPPSRLRYILEDAAVSIAFVADDRAKTTLVHAIHLLPTSTTSSTTSSSTTSSSTSPCPFPIYFPMDIAPPHHGHTNPTDDATVAAVLQQTLPTSDAVSHIFFTSGSTGRPKGCISTHNCLVSYCQGKNQCHRITADSVVFVASPHTFDPSFGDMFATWTTGGIVACATKHATFTTLGHCLSLTQATHVLTTPALLGTMPNGPPKRYNYLPTLQVVALGGEATPIPLALKRVQPLKE